jgi:ATP-binding cassette subfamily F protein 3
VQEYAGALVIVSHDRYFLDKTTNRTWEIAFGGLEAYRGHYSSYLRQRQERFQQRMKQWQTRQEYIIKTEDFIRRHIAGQRSKETQGRRKHLERFYKYEAIAKPQRHKRLRLRLQPAKRSGDIVLQLHDLTIGYQAGQPLASIPKIEVRRGDRIALIGPNGAGKTTLVRTILQELAQLEGDIRQGANLEMGYLPQAHDYLEADLNSIEAVQQIKPELRSDTVRSFLGTFLLSGDEVFKRLSQLSGGQRSRIALARLAVLDANLLILDEPSNHLDISSQEVLTDALQNFGGTLLLVSHDRYLIQAIAAHIWHIDQGHLTVF